MIELASKHNGLGYPMLHGMLKAEQLVVNRKHTYRLYAEEKLQLKNRCKNKLKRPRMPLVVPLGTDIRWSMDFVSDQLSNGRSGPRNLDSAISASMVHAAILAAG